MKYRILLLLLGFFIFSSSSELNGQDFHFTLYDYAPISINPANTGNYEGTFRVGGVYRDQWSALSGGSSNFRTPMFYADAPILTIGKKGWLGVGLGARLDESGSLDQQTNEFKGSVAYHHAISKKTTLSVGVQGGSRTRKFGGINNANPEDQLLGGQTQDPSILGIGDDDNSSGLNLNGGIGFHTRINKKSTLSLGAAGLNFTQPNQSITDTNGDKDDLKLPIRINLHGAYNVKLNDKWALNPTVLFSNIRNQNALNVQVWSDYTINQEKEIDLRFGLGHRLGRDLQPLLGLNWGTLRVAAGYDLRLGDLNNPLSGRGGFEIGVGYVARIFKKPDVPPVIFCPQF